MKTPGEIMTETLDATGVPWRRGGTSYHFNIFCPSNLKPWTEEQRQKLDEALERAGEIEFPVGNFERFGVSQKVCFPDGKYFESRTMDRLRAFRVYTTHVSQKE